jgi:DNA-binding transcriptional LysR family regulator
MEPTPHSPLAQSLPTHINYRLLHNFLQVAQATSFRDASGKIHRSSSVVSAQIKQLEQQIGARLFHRTTRSVALTPEGELLLRAARNGFREIESGLRQLQETLDLRVGRIAVASSPIMAATFLPPLLAEFEAHYPAIRILVSELTPAEIAHSLKNGDADFGIGPRPPGKEFSFQPLLQEDIVALVPKKFKPTSRDSISLRELSRIPTLQLSQATALRSVLQQAARKHGIELIPKYECTQAQTLIAMAHEELGAAILPASIIPSRLDKRVQALRIVQPALKRPIGLITWPQRSLSPAAGRLAALCVAHKR